MRILKHGHACVRVEQDDVALVLDPGSFTDAAPALDGATAVLITHEHADHYVADNLRLCDAPIFTIAAVAEQLRIDAPDVAERAIVVAPGERFEAGLPIRAVGELHAVIHPELPRVTNSGFLIEAEQRIFHPGDALVGPDEPVDLLLLPVSAPWLRVEGVIDFAREVGAPQNLAIHDRVYSEAGLGIVDGHLGRFLEPTGQDYRRLAEGAEL